MMKNLYLVVLICLFNIGSFAQQVHISGGHDYSIAICTSGMIMGWGSNGSSQIGSTGASLVPSMIVDASLPSRILQLTAGSGSHGVALSCDSMIYTWGANASGQLGHGTNSVSETASKVVGIGGTGFLTAIKSIGASKNATYAITSNNRVVAWGDNTKGKLGNGKQISTNTPVNVVRSLGQLTNIRQVQGTDSSGVALAIDSTVYTWGNNFQHQLGRNTVNTFDVFASQVKKKDGTTLKSIVQISAGGNHVLALDKNGNVWSWGSDLEGQLGQTDTNDSKAYAALVGAGQTSVLPANLEKVTSISAGFAHSLAVLSDGSVVSWGSNKAFGLGADSTEIENNAGILGLGTGPFTPNALLGIKEQSVDFPQFVLISADTKFTAAKTVSSGDNWAFIVTKDSLIYAMGYNAQGQLGIGNTTNPAYPVQLSLPTSCTLGSDCSVITANLDAQVDNEILYPSPFTDQVYYSLNNGKDFELTISDLHGVEISKNRIIQDKGVIQTSHLPVGVYIFKFVSGTNVLIKKVSKN